MSIAKSRVAFVLALAIIGCGDHGSAGPSTGEWATTSPEVFSHTGAAYVEDEKCTGQDGILISATSIGPVRLGRPLSTLRVRCEIAQVKVPGSLSINGPVLAISVDGGLILFTVAGHDSAVRTAGTSSPAFRTPNGIGVGSRIRTSPARRSSICFRKDSDRITGVLVSRRPRIC
jgi:hypothetical protein